MYKYFIPVAHNFTEFEYAEQSYDMPEFEDDDSELMIEKTILNMMKFLPSDRERVILLLQIMKDDGYNFNNRDIATLFQIDYSWYMRVLRGIRRKLLPFSNENYGKMQKIINNFDEDDVKIRKSD